MEYDVVIAGSGPAGAAAAWFLSGSGLRVVLIDRLAGESYGRYHSICGGGISRRSLSRIPLKEGDVLNDVRCLRLRWPGDVVTDIKIDGCVIDRVHLAKHLIEESGAEVIHGSVKDVWPMGDICSTILSDGTVLKSRYVIGADGVFSAVRKSVFRTVPTEIIPLEECITDAPAEDVFDFTVGSRFRGVYGWTFPKRNGSTFGSAAGALETEARVLHRFIPTGCVPEAVKGNVILIGDAAGLPNPLSFGGLRTAFESAEQAAKAIAEGNISGYATWWKKASKRSARFMELREKFRGMSDDDLADFSRSMTHRSLYLNGLLTIIRRPRYARACIGCLMALRLGW